MALDTFLSTSPGGRHSHSFKKHINLKGMISNFYDTSASQPVAGALYILFLGDETIASGGNNNYIFFGTTRLRFKDP